MRAGPTLAVVGATGAVGTVMLDLLGTRADPWGDIRLVASPRSAGRVLAVRGEPTPVEVLSAEVFDDVDVAMFDVPDEVSAEWAPIAAERGAVVVDNSGAFRMDPGVPLVVPEVNAADIAQRPRGIVSNPNCTTLSMIVVLGALHRRYGLTALTVASYQAASGAGRAGIDTLRRELAEVAADKTVGETTGDVRRVVSPPADGAPAFPSPLALNVIPWAGSLREDGYTSEELKVRNETRKILGLPGLSVSATCVRVPVITAHSLAVHAVFREEVDRVETQSLLRAAPGVVVEDDPSDLIFPMPIDTVGTDPTRVGRIRRSIDDNHALDMFICGDNLRKGAALNTAQIAELLAAEWHAARA